MNINTRTSALCLCVPLRCWDERCGGRVWCRWEPGTRGWEHWLLDNVIADLYWLICQLTPAGHTALFVPDWLNTVRGWWSYQKEKRKIFHSSTFKCLWSVEYRFTECWDCLRLSLSLLTMSLNVLSGLLNMWGECIDNYNQPRAPRALHPAEREWRAGGDNTRDLSHAQPYPGKYAQVSFNSFILILMGTEL